MCWPRDVALCSRQENGCWWGFSRALNVKLKIKFLLSELLFWFFCCHTFHLHFWSSCFSHLQMSTILFKCLHVLKSHLLHNNTALLIPSYAALLHLCACSCSLWIAVYSHHTTALTFTPPANGFLMDSLSLTSFWAHLCACQSTRNPPLIG